VDRTLSSFMKGNRQPIFIGIVLFAALAYPCQSFFVVTLRHSANQQKAQYPGPQNTTCDVFIRPAGSIRAGKKTELDIDEIPMSCDSQPLLPASAGATVTKGADYYIVSFVPQREGSLKFTFQGAEGCSKSYTYKYKADPTPIVATLSAILVLAPGIALLIVLLRRQIRAAKGELRKMAKADVLQIPIESAVAENSADKSAMFGVPAPTWLDPAVEALTQYGKLAASMTAIVYVVGIFVVNAYLSQWGASDYSLLKPRALLAGLWFIFFLSLCIFPMRLFFGRAFKPPPPRENAGSVLFLLIAFGSGIFRLIGFLFALCVSAIPLTLILAVTFLRKQGGGTLSMPEFLPVVAIILGVQFFGALIGESILQLVRRLVRSEAKKGEVGQTAIGALVLMGFLLFFAFAFARAIYWKIPDAFGGGGVHNEVITFKDLDDNTSAILRGPKCVSPNSNTYGVVFSGDSYILLACPEPESAQIFRLDRKYIVAESWPPE
jgi:hypothetical protein